MSTVGSRLKEVRERAGKSQEAFAALAGVGKRTQINYEKDLRNPDAAYMAAIATAGLDVLYILTGQRTGNAPAPPALTPEQRALLDNYAACSPLDQKAVRALASTAAQFHQMTGGRKAKGGKK